MDSTEFKNQILIKRPRYAKSRIPMMEAFANKGQSKSEYSQFGPLYELYIYAFILGIKIKSFLPLPNRNLTQDFVEIGKWKRDSSLVDFLLMIVFTHSDEIGFNWNELEDLQENELNKVITNIISFIEGYANGGLEFLQNEHGQNRLINSPYLFVDILAENTSFKIEDEHSDESNLNIEQATAETINSTKSIIAAGESTNVEFKSTLRVNLHTNQPDEKMEMGCIKTMAAFMNTKSGVLIIGVSDKKEVLGLDVDFKSFGNKHDLMDEFQKHLDNLIENYIGNLVYSLINITFPELDGKIICRIDIVFSKRSPVYVKNKIKKSEDFYIRRAASSIALNPSEMVGYIENHWD